MPVSFLTKEQVASYGRFPGPPSSEELARHFHLDERDRALLARRRGDHSRLGFALQLCTARFLGTFLEDPTAVPKNVVTTLADQLRVSSLDNLVRYGTSKWRWVHASEIRIVYGYLDFAEAPVGWRLCRWLYALCWTGTDRPSVLFDRAASWLLAHKILLPGASVLERFVARIRSRVEARLWSMLARDVTGEQSHHEQACS